MKIVIQNIKKGLIVAFSMGTVAIMPMDPPNQQIIPSTQQHYVMILPHAHHDTLIYLPNVLCNEYKKQLNLDPQEKITHHDPFIIVKMQPITIGSKTTLYPSHTAMYPKKWFHNTKDNSLHSSAPITFIIGQGVTAYRQDCENEFRKRAAWVQGAGPELIDAGIVNADGSHGPEKSQYAVTHLDIPPIPQYMNTKVTPKEKTNTLQRLG
jgi:hypothetical protein